MENQFKRFRSALVEIGDRLEVELAGRLVRQGHKATGKLINSIRYRINDFLLGLELEMSYLSYGRFLETGIPPERIPFSPGSGAKTSKYISGLVAWVKFKRLTSGLNKSPLGIAIAIARKQKQKGYPLTGKIGFQSQILREQNAFIEKTIDSAADEAIAAELDDLINDITKQFSNVE